MNEAIVESLDWEKGDGLLPAIVQDADSGVVLMLGYLDRVALNETIARKRVVFYSRSRQERWEKGATSGNRFELVGVTTDCDADALLLRVRPTGPACHTGQKACFVDAEPPLAMLAELERTVAARAEAAPPSGSYTATLLADGVNRIAQKLAEEAVEAALAAVSGSDKDLAGEAADLLYHLIVLLQARGMQLADITATLASRQRGPLRCTGT